MPLLVWRSADGSRAAWAYLVALCGVMGLVLFFGAPKVRNLLGVGLWTAMILPGLLTVATTALVMVRGDYDLEPKPVTPSRVDPATLEQRRMGVRIMAGAVGMIGVGLAFMFIDAAAGLSGVFSYGAIALIVSGTIALIRGYARTITP
jgi:hypothetical protein